MKVSVVCAGLFLFLAVFWTTAGGAESTPSPATSPSASPPPQPCKVSLDLAELAAIGSTHRYAEYILQIRALKGVTGSLTIRMTAITDAGATTPVVVSDFDADARSRTKGGSPAVIVVLPAAGIRWFAVDSVETNTRNQVCTNVSYALSTSTYATDSSFDDTAPWVTVNKPIIVRISDADFKNRVSPVYPDMAKEMNIQGDVTVKCIVGPDGNVEDASVVESSGSTELDDAGLTAAQETTYAPAHLPQTYGGLPIGWAYLLIYTFALR